MALGFWLSVGATLVLFVVALLSRPNRGYYLHRSTQCLLVTLTLGVVYLVFPRGVGRSDWSPAKRQVRDCSSNVKNLAVSLDMYAADYHGLYPKSLASLTPNYLKCIPQCPSALKDTYSVSYQSYTSSNGTAFYTVNCQGKHHLEAGYPADYPVYSSTEGFIQPK